MLLPWRQLLEEQEKELIRVVAASSSETVGFDAETPFGSTERFYLLMPLQVDPTDHDFRPFVFDQQKLFIFLFEHKQIKMTFSEKSVLSAEV